MTLNHKISYFKKYITNPFYQNSLFLLLSSLTNNASGFFFWIIAALMFSQTDIGLASAIISVNGLCILFSRFGIDQSLIRFFPHGNKSRIFTTTLIATVILTLVIGIIYLIGIDFFSPDLSFIQNYPLIFLLFLIANLIKQITSVCFVAIRASRYFFSQNIVFCSRILFLIPLISMGAMGIFSAVGIGFILASVFSLIYLLKFDIHYEKFDFNFLRDSFKFSTSNYLVGISMEAPKYLIPLMILYLLGPVEVAQYYIPFTFCSILFAIPNATSTQVFVEGSHGESLKTAMRRSLFTNFLLLSAAISFIYIFGPFFLNYLGKGYAGNLNLMMIISISSYFIGIFSSYYSIKNIQKDFKNMLLVSGAQLILHIVFCWILLINFGLIGAAYSWLISYAISSLFIYTIMNRER